MMRFHGHLARTAHLSGRLALSALLAGSVLTHAAAPLHAGTGDFIGGLGTGIIINEMLRGGQNGQRQQRPSGEAPRQRSHSPRGPERQESQYGEGHRVQQALTTLGFYNGAIDGDGGTKTQAAIRRYQESKQIPQTGVLDEEQRGLLKAEADLHSAMASLGSPDVRPSSDRDQKKRVQAALKALGHYTGEIDGSFGQGTSKAIAAYQKAAGMSTSDTLLPEQEKKLVSDAHASLSQTLANIDNQFAAIAGRQVAGGGVTGATPVLRSVPLAPAAKAIAGNAKSLPPVEAVKDGLTPKRKYDVAVVIGNKSYRQKDIPEVAYGVRDAEGIRALLVNDMGFDPQNIIWAQDASQAEMLAIFGSSDNAKGKLWRYIDPEGRSNVLVYYSGHGAPDVNSHTPYLLPVDTDPNAIAINGFSLDLMYKNLGQLQAKSVSVLLDACFSGGSHKGMLIQSASPVMVSAEMPKTAATSRLTVLAAADGNQLASWDDEKGHGLFTSQVIEGLKGPADANADGKITLGELHAYVRETVARQARRDFGREQTPKLMGDPNSVVAVLTR
ncbi:MULTISPECIES: peptidoglycan-binding protein [Rhodomicrobium]|uniref:peptidoglycan-binding protein n=1 Tax=Rhodomicrobium TaxID=1068 RepID=UPI000B4B9F9E|nr:MULTISPECIES: peptidoglycan-binding protein [Rhodomicrobium]